MSTAFTENLKERFAGQLSEGEAAFCSTLQKLFHATLSGTRSFGAEMAFLWSQLHQLRKFNYDVDAAAESGTFDPAMPQWLALKQTPSTALSGVEKAFLEDALGLIDWVVRNGVSFSLVLQVLGHDVGELSHHDFSLDKTLADFVQPKVSGWAKRNLDPVGESEDQS